MKLKERMHPRRKQANGQPQCCFHAVHALSKIIGEKYGNGSKRLPQVQVARLGGMPSPKGKIWNEQRAEVVMNKYGWSEPDPSTATVVVFIDSDGTPLAPRSSIWKQMFGIALRSSARVRLPSLLPSADRNKSTGRLKLLANCARNFSDTASVCAGAVTKSSS